MEIGTEPVQGLYRMEQREDRRLFDDSEPDRYVQTHHLYSQGRSRRENSEYGYSSV